MFNLLRKYLAIIFIMLFSLASGATLSGCMPQGEHVQPNGISVGALNKPHASDSAILAWANEAATAAFTYDFAKYEDSLKNASQYFTADGWQAFMTTVVKSGNLSKVIKNQYIVSAVATGTPVILAKGEAAGRYSWKVQLPLLVTYQSAKNQQSDNLIVTMLIVRTSPAIEGKGGLGIKQFIALKKAVQNNNA